MRETQRALIHELERNAPAFPLTIFSNPSSNLRSADIITIVFHLSWPQKGGIPLRFADVHDSITKNSAYAAIIGTKDFLERHLMNPLKILEVRTGCIRVIYEIEGDAHPDDVYRAVLALLNEKDQFGVFSANARVAKTKIL